MFIKSNSNDAQEKKKRKKKVFVGVWEHEVTRSAWVRAWSNFFILQWSKYPKPNPSQPMHTVRL